MARPVERGVDGGIVVEGDGSGPPGAFDLPARAQLPGQHLRAVAHSEDQHVSGHGHSPFTLSTPFVPDLHIINCPRRAVYLSSRA
jgi:hypothetical protein